ncbi:hypothetical protein POM88_028776 [Heracleum sosnowskyi]|uniref:Exocyst subunit Exo70 family protein n=1 Tax=Heracleum sosnowskyi TaxID=360622 RepID=A0AAD8HUJ4_9APIA|nr:hypothetical protein POM88_028776 [Heracleum sosnowskyi]
MDGDNSIQSIASSFRTSQYTEIKRTITSSLSWTSAGVSASTDSILTAFESTTVHQLPSASPVSWMKIDKGFHTYRFKRYSQRGLGKVMQLTPVQQIVESNCKDVNISHFWSPAEVGIDFGSATQLKNDGDHEQSAHNSSAVAIKDIMPSIYSRSIQNHKTPGTSSIQILQEFRGILDRSISISNSESSTLCSSSVTSNFSYELQGDNHLAYAEFSPEQIYHLHGLIKWLNSAGCLADCSELYRVSRKSALAAKLLRFGIGKWSINYLKSLDREKTTKISLWILAANNCYHNIFPRERHYYERIFDGVGAVTYDNCFLAIVTPVAVELTNFVESISAAIASFQNLFDILDLYEAMLVLLPKIEATFQSKPSLDIYSRATKTIDKLIILARKLFLSFEDTVLNEQIDTPLPRGGGVHRVTRYVMDYVSRMSTYNKLLTDILVSMPTRSLENLDEEKCLRADQGRTPLEQHVTWIIISLRINLEKKSCHYRDLSLRYAFILYNVDYIVQIINDFPKLREMIEKEYLSKLDKDVAEAKQKYVSSTWDRVLRCLGDDKLNPWLTFYSGFSGNALKQKLKKFSKLFEEVCETQSSQLGPHVELRGHLLKLTIKKLIPAYKSFLDKFTGSKSYNVRYIKYSLQDLENKVGNLYSEQ